jgi:hypothetical protein
MEFALTVGLKAAIFSVGRSLFTSGIEEVEV